MKLLYSERDRRYYIVNDIGEMTAWLNRDGLGGAFIEPGPFEMGDKKVHYISPKEWKIGDTIKDGETPNVNLVGISKMGAPLVILAGWAVREDFEIIWVGEY